MKKKYNPKTQITDKKACLWALFYELVIWCFKSYLK